MLICVSHRLVILFFEKRDLPCEKDPTQRVRNGVIADFARFLFFFHLPVLPKTSPPVHFSKTLKPDFSTFRNWLISLFPQKNGRLAPVFSSLIGFYFVGLNSKR